MQSSYKNYKLGFPVSWNEIEIIRKSITQTETFVQCNCIYGWFNFNSKETNTKYFDTFLVRLLLTLNKYLSKRFYVYLGVPMKVFSTWQGTFPAMVLTLPYHYEHFYGYHTFFILSFICRYTLKVQFIKFR